MNRPSQNWTPLFTTLGMTLLVVPCVYFLTLEPSARADEHSSHYLVESPMGTWTSDDRPKAHLDGTVVFRESHTGSLMQIDTGGVVITPIAE